jgi:hypothetical protein
MQSINIRITSLNPALIEDIFGTPEPTATESIELAPGLRLTYDDHTLKRGIVDMHVAVSFILSVASGVASKYIASWLYEKLKGKTVRVEIEGIEITKVTAEGIEHAVIKIRKK